LQKRKKMKNYIFTFITIICIFNSTKSYSQQMGEELKILKKTLETTHISPRVIDDQFSKDVFRRFIKLIDPAGLILTQQDYAKFKVYETTLDEAFTEGNDAFIKAFAPIFKEKLQKRQEIIEKITSQPLDFAKKESLYSRGKKDTIFHIADEDHLYKVTERLIKYACLLRYEQNKETQTVNLQTYLPQVRAIELRKIKRVLEHAEGFQNYVENRFLLAIALCYDPHTVYMNKTAVQSFMSSISPEGLSFGLTFNENEQGEIVVEQLIPGSPAWNSNELHEGDVLLSIQWVGKKVIEFNSASLEEVHNVIEQSNQGAATFVVRKKDNKTQTVKLTKAYTRQDENIVKGYIIHGKRKIGYISLPAFYQGMARAGKKGCAQDIGSAIIKMKKEGIEGLILDIRNNGGGDIEECTDLAGIFIEEGALVVVNDKQNKPVIIKDANRGTIFDEPLIVMVNRYSASASEILASTLQDYNRALIVGSNTYGKATGQGIKQVSLPNGKIGFVKVTEIKIYRINGKTAQFIGVQPHIELPDLSEIAFQRESDEPHALHPDVVNKKVLYTKLPDIPLDDLKQKHLGRMTTSNPLQKLIELIKNTENISKNIREEIPLDVKGFQAWIKEFQDKMPSESDINADANENKLPVETIKEDIIWLEQDAYAKEMHENVRKSIAADLHIHECYQILLDWIGIK